MFLPGNFMKFNIELIKNLRHSLVFKLILFVGITLLLSIATWTYVNIEYQKEKIMEHIVADADRLSNTIKLGTHHAMMLNARDDINRIIKNIGRQEGLKNIRIYNKRGQIKFSNKTSEVESATNIRAEACYVCHRSEPPPLEVGLTERARIYNSPEGYRLLGILSPIYNEPNCSNGACHAHLREKKILGTLDVVRSLEQTDKGIVLAENRIIALSIFVFLVTSAIVLILLLRFVDRPLRKLISRTGQIQRGEYPSEVDAEQDDEMGQMAIAINQIGKEIREKQTELSTQRDEYQALFERVPCLITVQDRNYRLLRYNSEFAESFDPKPGDYCFHAYKGRSKKCVNCPVEKTFEDGESHYGEETGRNKDGTITHWILRTSPIKNTKGEIVAAMEMSVDITERRHLEKKLQKSEKKYHEIFNNIPNPVFVLDADTLEIIDCNQSVRAVYGYSRDEIVEKYFLDLLGHEDKEVYAAKIKKSSIMNRVRQVDKAGRTFFVDIWISPSDYPGKKVLLVTTSDITERLETEQQLIQASKMGTLGEMASGVAHELNQPLSVIKTTSSWFIKKMNRNEKIDDEILFTMLSKVDTNVDRATKIINHMRQFARKSGLMLVTVQVNDVLERAFEIFSQQLRLRGVEVAWEIEKNLPLIMGDPDRMEQVFINLLMNARDAIEEKWGPKTHKEGDKRITLRTWSEENSVFIELCDTGSGMPETISDKIFEPFFTTKEVGKGTGLGLSISYSIVKDCGGTIQIKSTSAEGTCFNLRFPIKGEE